MKKIFTLLAVALCAIGASAQTKYVFDKNTCNETKDTPAPSTFTFTTNGKTFTVESSNTTKTLGFGSKNGLDEGVKYSANDYTITIPEGVNIASITFKAYTNDNSNKSYVVVNGESHAEDLFESRINTTETVLKEYTYSVTATDNKITFKPTKKQIVAVITLSEAPTATIGATGYATFCPNITCKVPTGLTAYTAAYNSSTGKVDLKEVADGIIPAKTGVILKGAAKDYTMAAAETTATELAGNELVGLTEAHEVAADDNAYILVNDEGEVKFGKATVGSTIAAGKVYLPIANANAAKLISMDFGGTNGINAVETVEANDGAYYTLSGVKTLKPAKGQLYIHNGKKFLAK